MGRESLGVEQAAVTIQQQSVRALAGPTVASALVRRSSSTVSRTQETIIFNEKACDSAVVRARVLAEQLQLALRRRRPRAWRQHKVEVWPAAKTAKRSRGVERSTNQQRRPHQNFCETRRAPYAASTTSRVVFSVTLLPPECHTSATAVDAASAEQRARGDLSARTGAE